MWLYFRKDNLVCNIFPKKETHIFLLGERYALRHLITLYIIVLVVTTLIVAMVTLQEAGIPKHVFW